MLRQDPVWCTCKAVAMHAVCHDVSPKVHLVVPGVAAAQTDFFNTPTSVVFLFLLPRS